jgi:hypothetical protein
VPQVFLKSNADNEGQDVLIPDQTQKADTIITNIMGYLFDDMQPFMPPVHACFYPSQPHPD